MGLIMACYGGLWGILIGITKSTDHPSKTLQTPLLTIVAGCSSGLMGPMGAYSGLWAWRDLSKLKFPKIREPQYRPRY